MSKWSTHHTYIRVRIIFFALIITSMLTGCIGDKASKNAKQWYRAVNNLDGLRADELTCSTRRSEVRSWMAIGSAFLGLGQSVAGDLEIDVDISGVSFQTIENYDGQAIVAVHGEYRGAVGGIVSTDVIDERWLMIVEDGTWKWCGNAY
jgi:hypothetical protein